MKDWGTFKAYTPLKKALRAQRDMGVLFFRNERKEDLYELRKTMPSDQTFLAVRPDGTVQYAYNDPTMLIGEFRLVSIDQVKDPRKLWEKPLSEIVDAKAANA